MYAYPDDCRRAADAEAEKEVMTGVSVTGGRYLSTLGSLEQSEAKKARLAKGGPQP